MAVEVECDAISAYKTWVLTNCSGEVATYMDYGLDFYHFLYFVDYYSLYYKFFIIKNKNNNNNKA